MCGIVGEIRQRNSVDREKFQQICAALSHRGPDGEGEVYLQNDYVALGHRRLAIIDLSDAGRQPMSNEDASCWLVFNGEIYNYQSLRRSLQERGHRFRSLTDSEVILHAYEEWGRSCVQHFRGMFAFGLWDERRQRLWLVRDRLGIKPLYTYWNGDRFIFASELKAIVSDRTIPRELNMNSLSSYLAYGYVPLDRCIFRGFRKLPAGHHLTFSSGEGRIQVESYWDVEYSGSISNETQAVETLRASLGEIVRSHLVSDVPLGLFLSGGIDSSGVAAFMQATQAEPIRTFTVGFDVAESDETSYARAVADHLQASHHEEVLTLDRARDLIPAFADIYDEPFFDSSGLPTYLLSGFAHNWVTVALSGDGGDEVFAGYLWYDQCLASHRVAPAPGSFEVGEDQLSGLGHRADRATRDLVEIYFAKMGFLSWDIQKHLLGSEVSRMVDDEPLWLFRRFFHEEWPAITALQYLDLKTYLVDDILVKVDRASMAHGLEVRVPLLDHVVVEQSFAVNSSLTYKNGERKYLLKRALEGLLPGESLTARKKGFSIPIVSWMNQGLRQQARTMLSRGSLTKRGILQNDVLDMYLLVAPPSSLWLLLSLELWARKWLDDETIELPTLGALH